MRQGYLFSLLFFNIMVEVLANANRQGNEIKGIHIGKEEIKLFLFIDNIIIYVENPKHPIKEVLELISEYSKFSRYEANV